jgi:hypothetical protein
MPRHACFRCTSGVLFVSMLAFAMIAGLSRSIAASELGPMPASTPETLPRTSPSRPEGVFDGTWLLVPPPLAEVYQFIVHDSARDRMIVIDGELQAWTWTASAGWSPLAAFLYSPGPDTPILGGFYDPTGDRVVMLTAALREIWVLNLSGTPQWSKLLTTDGPSARLDCAAAIDVVRNRLVIVGGSSYCNGCPPTQSTQDVWALDLATRVWTKLFESGSTLPTARARGVAICDPLRDRLVAYGGDYSGGIYAFRFATNDWVPLYYGGTAAPKEGAAIYDPVGDRMVLAGVAGGELEVWAFTLSEPGAWSQIIPTFGESPPPLLEATLAYDPTNHRALLYGGYVSTEEANLWALSLSPPTAWSELYSAPSARMGHTAIVDRVRDRMIVHGGQRGFNAADRLSETWSLDLSDLASWTLLPTTGTPPVRSYHGAVWDSAGDRMVLWGGDSDQQTWALDLATLDWSPLAVAGTPPPARRSHTTIFDPVRRRMIVFGGEDIATSGYRNDVWALDLSAVPTWIPLAPGGSPPSPRTGAAAIYDPTQDRMLLFGGRVQFGQGNDLWSLSLAAAGTWTSISVQNPPPARAWHSAIYDAGRFSLVIHGGDGPLCCQHYNDTWGWIVSGIDPWRQLAPDGPIPNLNRGHSAIGDAERNRMVVSGGFTNRLSVLQWGASPLDVPESVHGGRQLVAAYPNPARGPVALEFRLAAAGPCALEVFDVAGQRLTTLVNRRLEAGSHHARWTGAEAAGVYFVRLTSAGTSETRRLVVLESASR